MDNLLWFTVYRLSYSFCLPTSTRFQDSPFQCCFVAVLSDLLNKLRLCRRKLLSKQEHGLSWLGVENTISERDMFSGRSKFWDTSARPMSSNVKGTKLRTKSAPGQRISKVTFARYSSSPLQMHRLCVPTPWFDGRDPGVINGWWDDYG